MLLDISANLTIFCFFKWYRREYYISIMWEFRVVKAEKNRFD